MITSANLYTITDMRKAADKLLRLATFRKEPIGILKNNQLKAYLVDAKTLESLESLIEDCLDQKIVIDRLVKAKSKDFRDLERFWSEHQLPV